MVECPECGSERIRQDLEFESMWCCINCNYRFLKESIEGVVEEEDWEEQEDEEDFMMFKGDD